MAVPKNSINCIRLALLFFLFKFLGLYCFVVLVHLLFCLRAKWSAHWHFNCVLSTISSYLVCLRIQVFRFLSIYFGPSICFSCAPLCTCQSLNFLLCESPGFTAIRDHQNNIFVVYFDLYISWHSFIFKNVFKFPHWKPFVFYLLFLRLRFQTSFRFVALSICSCQQRI